MVICSASEGRGSRACSRLSCRISRVICFRISRSRRDRSRKNRRRAIASLVNLPCRRFARRERSFPSGVRGPVLFPPCRRQRPFFIAGAWQGVPRRVLAPQRGAFEGSPTGLPFLRNRNSCGSGGRVVWGSVTVLLTVRRADNALRPNQRPFESNPFLNSAQVFGFHSRASRWASAICWGVICLANPSLAFWLSPWDSAAARLNHLYAST